MIKIDEIDKQLYGQNLKKIYGPYGRKEDTRSTVILCNENKTWTLSYPKYLMERVLRRRLEVWETVDHINECIIDNREENLQVLDRDDNIKKSTFIKVQIINCLCGKKFKQKYKNQKYCSMFCGRLYGKHRNQHN